MLLVLLAGGVAGLWKFGLPLLSDEPQTEPTMAASRYMALAPIIVPVIRNGAIAGHVGLSLRLELSGIAGEKAVQKQLPKLRDAFITEMHGVLALDRGGRDGRQLAVLRRRLLQRGESVLGTGLLRDIHFESVDQRETSG